MRFHPVSARRTHDEVADQLIFAIRSGRFAPGQRLPSIDALAREMRVSAPTVGRALQLLSRWKLVKVQRGVQGGITVLDNAVPKSMEEPPSFASNFSLLDLVEARRPVEVEIAKRAARNADEKDLSELRDTILMLERHNRPVSMRVYHDHRFHYVLGRIARNETLAYFQHQVLEQLYRRLTYKAFFQKYDDVESVIDIHWRTYEVIASRDEDQIVREMTAHLEPLEGFVRRMEEDAKATRTARRQAG